MHTERGDETRVVAARARGGARGEAAGRVYIGGRRKEEKREEEASRRCGEARRRERRWARVGTCLPTCVFKIGRAHV